MFKRIILVILILSLSGCAFGWKKRFTVGAEGAKTKIYGEVESGQVLYESDISISLGCWKIR